MPAYFPTSLRQSLRALTLALAAALLPASAALAEKGLPKPYVSPSIDAVLLPITAEVRKEFKLGKKAAGLVVVSVDPGGLAELYGIEPGEVITELDDKVIRRPVDLDSMIRYKLNAGTNYFFFEGTWKNKKKKTIVEITSDDYSAPVSVADIPRWRGYNAGGSKARGVRGQGYLGNDGYYYSGGYFYYADFCDGYLDYFPEIYDYTLVYVEEVIVTEVYITSIESSETVFIYDDAAAGYDWPDDDYYASEVDSYVYSEEFYAEYESTEYYYDDEAYDPETGLSYEEAEAYGYLEPETYDESSDEAGAAMDDGSGYDEAATDEGYVDDGSGYDEAATDEGYVDDGSGYDEAGTEEYYEEPAAEEYYEEPAAEEYYEEPAAEEYTEEPAYTEEPVAEDSGAGSCYYDDEGNEVCG